MNPMHPTVAATIIARHTVTEALEKRDLFAAPIMSQLGCEDMTNADWENVHAALETIAHELGNPPTDRDIRDARHVLTERGWAGSSAEVDAK